MYIGIDIGTSAVKTVLTDDRGAVVAHESEALSLSRPKPGWSEQDPRAWWDAVCRTLDRLSAAAPEAAAVARCSVSRIRVSNVKRPCSGTVVTLVTS